MKKLEGGIEMIVTVSYAVVFTVISVVAVYSMSA